MADQKKRREELLQAARDRLTQAENPATGDSGGSSAPAGEVRYRGQVVRKSGAGTPGAGSGGRSAASNDKDDVRAALQKIKDLYNDGLISRSEAERKRSEILDRL